MFYTEKDMKVAEDWAWKMLDSFNHEFMPNLEHYAHFYYKGKIVMDPWMNEKAQNCFWPDHDNPEWAVDPVEYYGEKTIEDFVTRLFVLRPNGDKLVEKIVKHIDENGRLIRTRGDMPIEVYVAMSGEQAEEENCSVCIEDELPESDRIYFLMDELPKEYVTVISNGWEKEVEFKKRDAKKVMNILYPEGAKGKYEKLINRCNGRYVRLIGYGD